MITLAFSTKHNQGSWFLTVWGRVRQVSPRFSLSVNVWLAFGAWITSEECLHQNTGYAHVLKLPGLFLFSLSFFHDCSKRSEPWSFLFLFLLSLSVHHNLSCSIKMSSCCENVCGCEKSVPERIPGRALCFWLLLLCWHCVFYVCTCSMCLIVPVYAQHKCVKKKRSYVTTSTTMSLFLSCQANSLHQMTNKEAVEGRSW